MAEISVPVYMRVGDGKEFCVGEITAEAGTPDGVIALPGFLKKVAAEVEQQIADRDTGRG
jgi:hypothetical protein